MTDWLEKITDACDQFDRAAKHLEGVVDRALAAGADRAEIARLLNSRKPKP